MKTVSSREFNHDVGRIKKASKEGPVFITDRGKPTHVLMSIEEYQKLTGANKTSSIADQLSMEGEYFEFEPPKLLVDFPKAAVFD